MLVKLQDCYGQVVSSDVLLSGFYQMSQEQNEKIQPFSSHLEGTLNEICSCFPSLIPERDMDNQLMNQLFYGMYKTLWDSMCYLSDNNTIIYDQLMVAAQKAKGKATEEGNYSGKG